MTFTKEQLIKKAQEQIAFCRHTKITGEGLAHVNQCAALFEIALTELTAPQVPVVGEHFQRGYDEGHSRGLTCGKLYKTDDQMRQHRAACVAAYRAEINGGEID
ncbi:hypothetical protein [Klebsiella aerogenes]|uniref:hypothetical protein n=1 Tax=Klebsiella aerogenes TaxID=548 RepID=UPI00062C83DC|nr:hypothetical protein [Klebsiella aerogenes]KKY64125.1 hypothetical protein OA41_20260 [Klebsiella aerogenes]